MSSQLSGLSSSLGDKPPCGGKSSSTCGAGDLGGQNYSHDNAKTSFGIFALLSVQWGFPDHQDM